ncbi:helix-turn-helix domain-containing protein [Cohnella suwonensis]|uniref:Helix-turn-helix domain-containing protein n=1 Tax=Cohnella suwonensis TaxID=696072 RepID=A0ABW0M2N6_9BACL
MVAIFGPEFQRWRLYRILSLITLISLSSVSQKFQLNASYLSRIFKEETSQSFTDYLLKLRMDEALNLLSGTTLKAYQIAEKVGIMDPYYFSHRFKKVFGVSLQEYKRSSQK